MFLAQNSRRQGEYSTVSPCLHVFVVKTISKVYLKSKRQSTKDKPPLEPKLLRTPAV